MHGGLGDRIFYFSIQPALYQVDDGGLDEKFLLAARFFTGRVLNMEAIVRTFKLLWHTKKGFEVCDMGNHRVSFLFSEESDIDSCSR